MSLVTFPPRGYSMMLMLMLMMAEMYKQEGLNDCGIPLTSRVCGCLIITPRIIPWGQPRVPNVLRSMGKTRHTHAFPLVTPPVRSPCDKV